MLLVTKVDFNGKIYRVMQQVFIVLGGRLSGEKSDVVLIKIDLVRMQKDCVDLEERNFSPDLVVVLFLARANNLVSGKSVNPY